MFRKWRTVNAYKIFYDSVLIFGLTYWRKILVVFQILFILELYRARRKPLLRSAITTTPQTPRTVAPSSLVWSSASSTTQDAWSTSWTTSSARTGTCSNQRSWRCSRTAEIGLELAQTSFSTYVGQGISLKWIGCCDDQGVDWWVFETVSYWASTEIRGHENIQEPQESG